MVLLINTAMEEMPKLFMMKFKEWWKPLCVIYFFVFGLTIFTNILYGHFQVALWQGMILFFVVMFFLNSKLSGRMLRLLGEQSNLMERTMKLLDMVIEKNTMLIKEKELWNKNGEVEISIKRSAPPVFTVEQLNKKENGQRNKNKTESQKNGK